MSPAHDRSRRFRLWMAFLMLPIFALLFFVTTMQRSHYFILEAEHDSVLRITLSSSMGLTYRRRIEAFNLVQNRWVGDWTIERDPSSYWVFDGGEQLLVIDSENQLIAHDRDGNVRNFGESQIAMEDWSSGYEIGFVEGGFVYEATDDTLNFFDLSSATATPLRFDPTSSWPDRKKNGWHWEFSNSSAMKAYRYASSREPKGAEELYHLDGATLVKIGSSRGFLRSGYGYSNDASWFLEPVNRRFPYNDGTPWNVVDTLTDKTISTVDGTQLLFMQVCGDQLFGYHRDPERKRRRLPVNAIQRFDPSTGKPLGPKRMFQLENDWTFHLNSQGTQLYIEGLAPEFQSTGRLQVLNVDSGSLADLQFTAGSPWWWPLRIVVVALAVIWWLVWSIGSRRDARSYQPLVDIAILHVALIVCFAAQLYAFMNGPYWDGSLHRWESVGFLGTASSAIGMVMLWVAHGPQRLGFRIGAIALALTLLAGFAVLVWDLDPFELDHSWERTKMLTGTAASGVGVLGFLWALWGWGVRLCHHSDQTTSGASTRGFSILHMTGWTVAFALLFVVLRFRKFELPDLNTSWQLAASGFASGLATGFLLWLGLGKTRWRYLLAITGFAVAGILYWLTEPYDVLRISAGFVPLLIVSTLAFRWNGYRLRRPTDLKLANEVGASS